MSDAEKRAAIKALADGMAARDGFFCIEYNEHDFYEGTRVLQRQPEYLELPFDQLIRQFSWLLNVSASKKPFSIVLKSSQGF